MSAKDAGRIGCDHCRGAGPEPGFIEQDNNGPIVACPFCNAEYDTPTRRREREFEAALRLSRARWDKLVNHLHSMRINPEPKTEDRTVIEVRLSAPVDIDGDRFEPGTYWAPP